MCTDLLSLTNIVEGSFNVTCLAGLFSIAGNLYSCFVINNEDGRDSWKALCRFTPLFSSKICHVVG